MGRPKLTLIDRDEAIAKALEIIDDSGLDGFSIRRLGSELGVHGASLYHHFADKDEILRGVRLLVLREGRVVPPSSDATWQEYLMTSVTRYREALVRHPNTAPLMLPQNMRPTGLVLRERIVAKMMEEGVPARFAYAVIDSSERLAFGSALQNPMQESTRDHAQLGDRTDLPHLSRAVRAAPRTAGKMFRLELEALLEGWTAIVAREAGATTGAKGSAVTSARPAARRRPRGTA